MDGKLSRQQGRDRSSVTSGNKPAGKYSHPAHLLAGSNSGGVASEQTQWGSQKTDAGTGSHLGEVLKEGLISLSAAASSHGIHNRLGVAHQGSHH